MKERNRGWQGAGKKLFAGVCLAAQLGLAAGLWSEAEPVSWQWVDEKGTAVCKEKGSGRPADVSQSQSTPKISLYARSAVLMDGLTGRILYGKNEHESRPMASTTKIMTCILALEEGKLDEFAEVSSCAASQPQVHMGVKKGERYRIRDLLYALMLESYNDAAVIIAEHTAGSTEAFSRLMNEKALRLGCRDTWFITPNGLDGRKKDASGTERIHSTTAADLARILCYCITQSPKKEQFLEITSASDYYFTDESGKRAFSCRNHNAFLSMMEGALTGKTGFTGEAGYCYTGALLRDERLYIIALLGSGWPPHKTYKWTDAGTLFSYGINQYELADVFEPEPDHSLFVQGGICWGENPQGILKAVMREEDRDGHLKLLLSKEEKEKIKRTVMLPESTAAPVKEGEVLGRVRYSLGDMELGSYRLYADRSVERLTFWAAWKHIWKDFLFF